MIINAFSSSLNFTFLKISIPKLISLHNTLCHQALIFFSMILLFFFAISKNIFYCSYTHNKQESSYIAMIPRNPRCIMEENYKTEI